MCFCFDGTHYRQSSENELKGAVNVLITENKQRMNECPQGLLGAAMSGKPVVAYKQPQILMAEIGGNSRLTIFDSLFIMDIVIESYSGLWNGVQCSASRSL